jgi:hypothetical protein
VFPENGQCGHNKLVLRGTVGKSTLSCKISYSSDILPVIQYGTVSRMMGQTELCNMVVSIECT